MPNTGAQQFYSALQQQAYDQVRSILNAPLRVIEYPQQGDFAWEWENPSLVFNGWTYDYVTARVTPGSTPQSVALQPANSFPNAYVQVLNAIYYGLSAADQATLTQADHNAATQRTSLVTDYQTTFGPVTSAQLAAAGYTDVVQYIVGYVVGTQWAAAAAPVTWTQMAAARNLGVLLPRAPMNAETVLGDITAYLNIMQPALGLADELQNGTWTLSQLKNNAMYPTVANGAMATFDPNTGAVTPVRNPAWGIHSAPAAISNDLANTARSISIGMTTTQGAGSSLSVSVEGGAAFSVGELLTFETSVHGSYDMSKSAGTSTDCSVTIDFKGYSIVPVAPLAWNNATNVGFYSPDPISQAVANTGKDVTGFKFLNPPPFDLGPVDAGGDFGYLSALLVSNYPTVTVTYQHGDFAAFKQSWSESVSGNLKLFGFIPLGGFSQGAYGSSYSESSDNSTFTVTFGPSPEVVSVPTYQQTAYVIGGAVVNPGSAS